MTARRVFMSALAGGLLVLAGCGSLHLKTRLVAAQPDPEQTQAAISQAPAFALLASDGATVSLDDLLAGGRPAVLVFYRGHW